MARAIKDAKLDTRAARERLPINHEPYWRAIARGSHLGYRKGKRGGVWLARFRPDGGSYIKKTLGKADDILDADGVTALSFAQAQDKAREWFAEQGRRDAGLPAATGPYTVADAMRDYLEWYATENKPSGLAMASRTVNAHINPGLGKIIVNNLTTEKIKRWRKNLLDKPARKRSGKSHPVQYRPAPTDENGRRARKATVNRIMTILRAGLNHAFNETDNGVTSDTAWRRVKPFKKVDAAKVRYLSADECTRLMNASALDFRLLVQAALLTGARYGELIAMNCDDYNADAGTVSVYESKSGATRHIPLNDEGVSLFSQLTGGRAGSVFLDANGTPWGKWQQSRALVAAAEAANVKNVTFHILRHTYASNLAMKGCPMSVIASALGHANTRMTEKHYAHLSPDYVADQIRANLPSLGISFTETVTPIRRSG